MACASPALDLPLHANIVVLAQRRREFFAKLSRRRLKHGVFHSIVDLQAAINRFIAEHNMTPRPFAWSANPDDIMAARKRGFQVLESIH
jgi:hypothetical protein